MNALREQVKASKFFYRDRYHILGNLIGGALCIIIILNLVLFYAFVRQPAPTFYASSDAGDLIQLEALDAPNDSDTPLIQ